MDKEGNPDVNNEIGVWFNNVKIFSRGDVESEIRQGVFVMVRIIYHDGNLQVIYDGEELVNQQVGALPNFGASAAFLLGARTGGESDDHFVDDLAIVGQ